MSKELPYFKFFTSEWLNGDITLEDYELQGIFVNLCAYYWHKDGCVDVVQAKKKLRTDRIFELLEIGIVKEDENNLTITFLDEQFSEFSIRKKRLSDAGKKGALAKKKLALLKGGLNNPSATREDKDKIREDKDKDNIREDNIIKKTKTLSDRKTTFKESLAKHKDKFDVSILNEFYSYWTEHGDLDKKMRFEKQTSFSIGRRLGTWKKNKKTYEFKSNTKDNRATTTKAERQDFN